MADPGYWFLNANCRAPSQPAEGGQIQAKRVLSPFLEGLMPPFSSFPFLEVSEWWFLGQGKSSICGYLNFGPIRSWADTSWGSFVCCGLWGALGSSAQWSQRGPGLTCQDLKNINLKNIVKNKYLGGKWSFFFFPTRKLLVEGLDGLLFLKCYCCSILDHFEIFPLSRMSLQGNGYNLG